MSSSYVLEPDHNENRKITMETNRILKETESEMRIAIMRETIEIWYPPTQGD